MLISLTVVSKDLTIFILFLLFHPLYLDKICHFFFPFFKLPWFGQFPYFSVFNGLICVDFACITLVLISKVKRVLLRLEHIQFLLHFFQQPFTLKNLFLEVFDLLLIFSCPFYKSIYDFLLENRLILILWESFLLFSKRIISYRWHRLLVGHSSTIILLSNTII